MKYALISVITLLLLSGCSTRTPPVQEYTLTSPVQSAGAPVALTGRILAVAPVKSSPSLSSKDILYLRNGRETGAYLYARWSDTPSVMLTRAMMLALEERHLFASVVPLSSTGQPDWLLESDLHSFYHRFNSETQSEGVIDITYRLVDPKEKRIIAAKRFTVVTAAATPDSRGGVDALNAAATRIGDECIRWLNTLIQENQ